MAKQIYLKNNEIENILRDIKNQLLSQKAFGSISFKKNFSNDKRKAEIYFTTKAWCKITTLVNAFSTEVQWHGCVNRISENVFSVYDILVPPHVVSSATVVSDYKEYSEWLDGLEDDVFNSMRFHGHSHVKMSCSPSSVDETYRKDVVTQIPTPKNEDEDAFYIFMIFNKNGDWTAEIYDIANNALYDTSDITIDVVSDDGCDFLSAFLKEAKSVAIEKKPEPSKTVYHKDGSYRYTGTSDSSLSSTLKHMIANDDGELYSDYSSYYDTKYYGGY